MKLWGNRPKEEAHLLNPAFCCVALTASVSSYTAVKSEGKPFPLLFMALPIVLHKPTRDLLPPNTRTSMASWLQQNPAARILFFDRVVSLKPHTQEAMLFGIMHDWLELQTSGLIRSALTEARVASAIRKLTLDARECAMKARFLGKWLALAGSPATVMALWGIRP